MRRLDLLLGPPCADIGSSICSAARQAASTLLAGQMARELNFTDIKN